MSTAYFEHRRYPPTAPPLRDGADPVRHKVAIVGGGPVGLTLALGLASQGVRSVVIEADDTVCVGSRATCISRRSLEIFAQLGIERPMLAKGLAWSGGRSYYRESEVFRLAMPHDENQQFPPMINLQQCFAEQYLADAAERSELIELRWHSQVTGVENLAQGVALHIQTPAGAYRLEADWLAACDGARSTVRQALGLELEGAQYEGRYVIVDILLESDYPTERRAWFDPPSNPGATLLMHKQPDNIWRIDYQLRADEDAEEAVRPENVLPRVRSHLAMIGERDDWEPVWISMYKANALTLERYRHGRVLFAGDAAHLVPIFGVRGLNSGIDDAHNLAWKLAYVVRGIGGEPLLDSYSDERVFAARENLRHAIKSTEFMAPPSAGFEVMRKAALSLALKHEWVRSLVNPRQTSAIAFHDSRLASFPERSAELTVGPAPGEILAECPLTAPNDETYLTRLVLARFTALCFSADGALSPALAEMLERLAQGAAPFGACVVTQYEGTATRWPTAYDHTGRVFEMYGAIPGTVYLVRPDGHIAARWRRAVPEELEAAVRHALMRSMESADDRRAA